MVKKYNKGLKVTVACAALLACIATPNLVSAAAYDAAVADRNDTERTSLLERQIEGLVEDRASKTFRMTVPADSLLKASSSFSMAANETITIDATYSPSTAKLDVGLIYPDGSFRYFSATGGRVSKTIRMAEAGSYTLAIQNNASYKVTVSGSVNY